VINVSAGGGSVPTFVWADRTTSRSRPAP
jgi:hypothetical protein